MLLQAITRHVMIIKYKNTTEKFCKLRMNKKVLRTEHAYSLQQPECTRQVLLLPFHCKIYVVVPIQKMAWAQRPQGLLAGL